MGLRLVIGSGDWARLMRHETPNETLVCPTGHCPNARPDTEPKSYPIEPAELLARLRRIALAEPDTSELYCGTNCDHTARILQHTRLMRFPDTIDIEVLPLANN